MCVFSYVECVISLVEGWFTTKKHEQDVKRDLQSQRLKGSDDYDTEALRQKQHSWSDEYLLILHTSIMWGYLIPSDTLHRSLDKVWDKLDTAPTEWWIMYGGMVISTFGLRFMWKRIVK